VTEQAAPLPILILATIFLLVWNMEPFTVQESEVRSGQSESINWTSSQMSEGDKIKIIENNQQIATPSSQFQTGSTNQVQKTE